MKKSILVATMAFAFTSSAWSVTHEEKVEKFHAVISDSMALLEVMEDVSSRCKIEIQVRGKKGVFKESCVKMYSLFPEYGEAAKALMIPPSESAVFEEVFKTKHREIAKITRYSTNTNANIEYINLSIK